MGCMARDAWIYFKMKKGQIEINETILVIFVFIVLVLIGLIAFNKFMLQGIEGIVEKNERARYVNMIATIPDMAELKCSSQATSIECLDTLKLLAFEKQSREYINIFGEKRIIVEAVYPATGSLKSIECTNMNYPNCGYWVLYENKPNLVKSEETISSPVSLYYPLSDIYGIGRLRITTYNL